LMTVSFFTTLAALTMMATRRVILQHGPKRCETTWSVKPPRFRTRGLVGYLTFGAPLLVTCAVSSVTEGNLTMMAAILAVAVGVGGGGAIVWTAWLVQALITSPATALPPIIFPNDQVTILAHGSNVVQPVEQVFPRLSARLQRYLGPGYFTEDGDLEPGHVFALLFLSGFAVVYGWGYFSWQPGTERGATTPTLVFVLIVGILSTWFLAGLGFFLDRFRLPTLLPIFLSSLLIWTVSRSDHYFNLVDAKAFLTCT
jgi:hypothetical protein